MIMNFLVMPMFFLSGALFPIAALPAVIEALIHANPLAYGIDAMRDVLVGVSYYGLALDFGVLVGCSAVLLLIGVLRVPRHRGLNARPVLARAAAAPYC